MKWLSIFLVVFFPFLSYNQSTIRDRHGTLYPTIKLENGDVWLAKNLSVRIDESWCWNNKDDASCKKDGRLYTLKAAEAACRNMGIDWALPTWDDWDYLRQQYLLKPVNNYTLYKQQQALYYALATGGKSKLDLRFGGILYKTSKVPALQDFQEGNRLGAYWSKGKAASRGRIVAFNVHRIDRQFYERPYLPSSGLAVRCIKK